MYLHHSKGIALAIREERGPQMIDFMARIRPSRIQEGHS
jgi:O-acetyl-ADP-ribose deacetylase (regulator of RNase III)